MIFENAVSLGKYIFAGKLKRREKSKTDRWIILNKKSDEPIGDIHWYGAWRQYSLFLPSCDSTVFNSECLKEIADFLNKLNRDHKKNLIKQQKYQEIWKGST
jgi:hypothetical protein